MKIEDNQDLATFLENSLKTLYKADAKSVAVIATAKDDDVFIGYYHCGGPTQILYAGYLQQDAMMCSLRESGMIADLPPDMDLEADWSSETTDELTQLSQ